MKIEYWKYKLANRTEREFLDPSLLFFCFLLLISSLVSFWIGYVKPIEYHFFFFIATVSSFLSISSTQSLHKTTFYASIREIEYVFQIFVLLKNMNWEELIPIGKNSWVWLLITSHILINASAQALVLLAACRFWSLYFIKTLAFSTSIYAQGV